MIRFIIVALSICSIGRIYSKDCSCNLHLEMQDGEPVKIEVEDGLDLMFKEDNLIITSKDNQQKFELNNISRMYYSYDKRIGTKVSEAADDLLNIKITKYAISLNPKEPGTLVIMNIKGEIVYRELIREKVELTSNILPEGIYIITFRNREVGKFFIN